MTITAFSLAVSPTTQAAGTDNIRELLKVVLTASIGAILGILSFVLGQLIEKMFIEPIQAQRQIVGKIAHAMTYWLTAYEQKSLPQPLIAEHEKHLKEASDAIRHLAAELRASITTIPLYGLMEKLPFVVSRHDIKFIGYLLMQWQLRMDSQVIALIVKELQRMLKTEIKSEQADKDIQNWVETNKIFLHWNGRGKS
jgi:hypothetical protein